MKIFATLFCYVLVMALSSCTSGKKSLREYKGSYLESVKLNFEAGEEALKSQDYEKAIGYFQFVRSKYPFSKYAALSDLKIADVKFAQKKWLDAASAYEVFIRLHPRHEEVGYASYRVSISYFHAIPSSFFLLPSPTTRDQTFTKDALAAMERFILQFPDSEYLADALIKRSLLFSYLAQHNQHIAHYYKRRSRYQASIDRYLRVEELYPETPESAQSLFLAAQIYKDNLKDANQASILYAQLIEKKPGSKYAEEALKELEKLQALKPHETEE